jgi:hypothetical protein
MEHRQSNFSMKNVGRHIKIACSCMVILVIIKPEPEFFLHSFKCGVKGCTRNVPVVIWMS